MKTRILILMATCLFASQTFINAQQKEQPRQRPTFEQMAQMKAERLAGELALDDKTAEKFIQTYIGYLTENRDLRKVQGECKAEAKTPGERRAFKSDADVEKMLLGRFDQRQKKLDLDRKYYEKFRKFLGPKQIMKMYSLQAQRQNHGKKPAGMTRPNGPRKPVPHSGK